MDKALIETLAFDQVSISHQRVKPARKGELTKAAIFRKALQVTRKDGLGAATFGRLAIEASMSKTGVFARFGSTHALQLEIVAYYACQFEEMIIKPGKKELPGLPRLHDVFRRWTTDIVNTGPSSVCMRFAEEYARHNSAVRNAILSNVLHWRNAIESNLSDAIELHQISPGANPHSLAQIIYGLVLSLVDEVRFSERRVSVVKVHQAYDALLEALKTEKCFLGQQQRIR